MIAGMKCNVPNKGSSDKPAHCRPVMLSWNPTPALRAQRQAGPALNNSMTKVGPPSMTRDSQVENIPGNSCRGTTSTQRPGCCAWNRVCVVMSQGLYSPPRPWESRRAALSALAVHYDMPVGQLLYCPPWAVHPLTGASGVGKEGGSVPGARS
jgi:hypothetical protein